MHSTATSASSISSGSLLTETDRIIVPGRRKKIAPNETATAQRSGATSRHRTAKTAKEARVSARL